MNHELEITNTEGLGLSAKEIVFCQEYTKNGFNASKAALSAGYAPTSAPTMGSSILKKQNAKDYIEKIYRDFKVENTDIFNSVTCLLTSIVNVTIDMYVESWDRKSNTIVWHDIKKWTPAMKKACNGIKFDARGKCTIELNGKQWATDMLAKHIAYYEDPNKGGDQVQNGIQIYLPDNKR